MNAYKIRVPENIFKVKPHKNVCFYFHYSEVRDLFVQVLESRSTLIHYQVAFTKFLSMQGYSTIEERFFYVVLPEVGAVHSFHQALNLLSEVNLSWCMQSDFSADPYTKKKSSAFYILAARLSLETLPSRQHRCTNHTYFR